MQFYQTPIRLAVTVMAAAVMTAPVHAVPEQSGIARALRDPVRGKDREQDARRHPAELIALAHIGPGQRVLDLIPGGGYWTRIFSNAVGPEGQVIAVWPQAYAGGFGWHSAILLYALVDGQLRQVLAVPMIALTFLAGEWHRDGTRDHEIEDGANVIVVTEHLNGSHADLIVRSRTTGGERLFRWDASSLRYAESSERKLPPNNR